MNKDLEKDLSWVGYIAPNQLPTVAEALDIGVASLPLSFCACGTEQFNLLKTEMFHAN